MSGGERTPGEVTCGMSITHGPDPSGGVPQPACSLLLVDDDIELCELLQEYMARCGICLEAAHDGRRGLARALHGGHDLLLLDVMMPGLDGFELLRLVRRQSQVPVIMLTARTTQADRVAGLDAGADDYLSKPFGTAELLARIRAVLRRAGRAQKEAEVLEAGGIRLIPTAREALADGSAVPLTTVEYDILEFLVHAAGRVVSRDELTAALYQRQTTRFDRSLDMHICNLRKKLGGHGDLIRTVRGVGYLFRCGPEELGEP
jgi:two-component system response regulator CpxR